MSDSVPILIIGGGAAGMTAAIESARRGARVLILERMSRVGKKLLATGNGRCNLTNRNMGADRFHGASKGFIAGILDRYGLESTLEFFEELGVVPRTEDEGKVFPITGQASSVLDVLRYEMERLGVEIICDANVNSVQILKPQGGFLCRSTDGRVFMGDRVILAAGGKSAPNLGSNGGGFKLAESLGHRIVEPFPALVQLRINAPFLKQLDGLKIEGWMKAVVDGQSQNAQTGEILFTDYGLSGPPILALSRIVSEACLRDRTVQIQIDLFPEWSVEELLERLHKRIAVAPRKPLDFGFVGLLHKRLIPVVLKEAGIHDIHIESGSLPETAMRKIAGILKSWLMPCVGTQSWMDSQATAGGVDVRDVNDKTLESQIVPGLYFAGEVLDVDGDCGGYNLQWAWSSGRVAGSAAAASVIGGVAPPDNGE